MYYIGADLGTSALKLLLVDEKGTIHNSCSKSYPLMFPHSGWSEQEPGDWWGAFISGMGELLEGYDTEKIAGIGVGGQMHGLVVLDSADEVIRPAILWNDGRTAKETEFLNETVGREKLEELTANIAFAGFTAPKLLWLKDNEPDGFARISKIMLPKDYINYKLTGVHACDYSDAGGMLLLDVKNRTWSEEMLDICGVKKKQMPKLYESFEVIGTVKPEIAAALGIPEHVRVVAGAGDNAAAAIGTGTLGRGQCNISLGTSGTIFISSDHFIPNKCQGIHNFAHADGGYHLMGCMLSAASCNKWFYEDILKTTDYDGVQSGINDEMLGNNSVYFLPYLMGERSPVNDTDARGTFIGMTMNTSREDCVLAVLEGVAFAIRDSFEAVKDSGMDITRSKICGGGARSKLWVRIIANILNIPLDIPETEQGPGFGGAMLAMTGCGEYENVKACADALIHVTGTIEPEAELAALYDKQYKKYREIYPALKPVFAKLI